MGTTNATAPKSAAKKSSGFKGIKHGIWVILICFLASHLVFYFGAGHASHFAGGAEQLGAEFVIFAPSDVHPTPDNGNLIGTVYLGGFIVPIIWGLMFTVLCFCIERFFAIRSANGRGNVAKFVADIKAALAAHDLEKAQAICDKQQGSVANVVSATLKRWKLVEADTTLSKEQQVLALQKELEEATALEMPMMQENLPIIGSIVTLGTLTGLLGTVLGMIKSFGAMSAGDGGADSTQLATGISEALVNTASGIATSLFAVIGYNYYTNKIDRLTFCIDEVGFCIVQTYNATH